MNLFDKSLASFVESENALLLRVETWVPQRKFMLASYISEHVGALFSCAIPKPDHFLFCFYSA